MTAQCRCYEQPSVCVRRRGREELLLIDGLHELSDHQGHALYPLDLFLCPNKLTLETPKPWSIGRRKAGSWRWLPLLVFNVFFLQVDVSMIG